MPERCHGHDNKRILKHTWMTRGTGCCWVEQVRKEVTLVHCLKQLLTSACFFLGDALYKERTQENIRTAGRVCSKIITLESQRWNKWFIGLAEQQVTVYQSLPLQSKLHTEWPYLIHNNWLLITFIVVLCKQNLQSKKKKKSFFWCSLFFLSFLFFPPSFVSVCVCAALLSLLCAQWFCSPFEVHPLRVRKHFWELWCPFPLASRFWPGLGNRVGR